MAGRSGGGGVAVARWQVAVTVAGWRAQRGPGDHAVAVAGVAAMPYWSKCTICFAVSRSCPSSPMHVWGPYKCAPVFTSMPC